MVNILIFLLIGLILGGMISVGYRRGVLRMISISICLFFASLISKPFAGIFNWIIQQFSFVPRALTYGVAWVLAGLVIYTLLQWLAHKFLARVERDRIRFDKVESVSSSEHYLGAFVGLLFGGVLLFLIFVVVHFLAGFEELMMDSRSAVSSNKYQTEQLADMAAEHILKLRAERLANSKLNQIKEKLDDSPLSAIVRRGDPLTEKRKVMIRQMNEIIGQPDLRAKFVHHPKIEALSADPAIAGLKADPRIKEMIVDKKFNDLLDNEKVAVLLTKTDIFKQMKNVDMAAVICDINEQH